MTDNAEISRVGVVGCGVMGAGLAEISAKAGLDVLVAVTSTTSEQAGRKRIERSLANAVAKGKLGEDERDSLLERITFTTDIGDFADRQLVVEAVTEHEPTKLKIFSQLDAVLEDDEAILATNTSSLSIMRIARATERPGQVIGTHFFNPVPVLPLVEVVGSLLTEQSAHDRLAAFLTDVLGKEVVRAPDRSGFVVNALLVPFLMAAMRMVESGFAAAADIDRGMTLGCAHPMGPLRLADLIGLDTLHAVATEMYEEHKEPLHAPPPLLARMVDGGLLGKKSGRGFYDYR
ncbi:3-hydroxyacyl-CoA dehydrogenase NAD-binding domain-containing protein [Saccharopolyspora indica]|uniref:3-hydroxybutyryl-CoA dehydrogenase n=1 Tax=Saccharopolyspora indica TaxID=1229659 RepID=UPI0022EB059D|nr:3-hydroxybutyryl-CoA dehydrogenase [Saccharopolyspora indica]MDA3647927.1 3-hydroxybutyryl-CoA dehydrogenase [Saccharopolyspora indica]